MRFGTGLAVRRIFYYLVTSRAIRASLLAALLLSTAWAAPPTGNKVVIFKDGFSLQGEVKQESTVLAESGVVMSVPKNNFFVVDDGARRIMFHHKLVQDTGEHPNKGNDPLRFERKFVRLDKFRVPAGIYGDATPWDARWDRVQTLEAGKQKNQIAQHMSILTPHYARIDAKRYAWSDHLLTKELDPKIVKSLLLMHPDLKLNGGKSDAAKRFRIFNFMVQAEWYDQAMAELDDIEKQMPDQKEKCETSRDNLKRVLTSKLLDKIELGQRVGRHQWVQERLTNFPQQYADERLMLRVRALQASYETITKNLVETRRLMEDLPPRVSEPAQRSVFGEAAGVMLAELNTDTVNQLEAFAALALQAERERSQNRTPSQTPEQLLALAVSGWLLGNNSAEAKVDTALRMWRARQFVLEYQKLHDPVSRQRLLASYAQREAVAFDELAQIIRALPPPEPFETAVVGNSPWAAGMLPIPEAALFWAFAGVQKSLPSSSFQLQANLPWTYRRGPTYHLQLPAEYHPGRLYPVLFVLHETNDSAEEMLRRFGPLAFENGYMLVAPDWDRGLKQEYRYTVEEQRTVLEVLRDLSQRFQIDPDRVFMAGAGQGGNMAFDVGLSHPDCFAGVMSMSGRPKFFARAYRPNGQYLPFYVIDGDMDSESSKENRQQFEFWLQHSYPSIWVQYKGRGSEWFGAELPTVFDWMNRKKRATAVPELGRFANSSLFGDEFQCMRPTDNHFYWLSGEELHERHVNDGRSWSNKTFPATLQARISEGNQINIHASGFRRVTVWLGPGMIDFEKPAKILLNSQVGWINKKIAPDLATMLEDYYLRGDRKRVFYARVELPL